MTPSTSNPDNIVEDLAAISGVMRDDIHVSGNTVTTYIPINQLEDAEALEDVEIKIIEEYEHEYLISVRAK